MLECNQNFNSIFTVFKCNSNQLFVELTNPILPILLTHKGWVNIIIQGNSCIICIIPFLFYYILPFVAI